MDDFREKFIQSEITNGISYQNLIDSGLMLLKVFQANDWSRGARPPRAHNHAPRGVTSKNAAKGRWNFMCRARGAPDCARGERDPREEAAMITFLKSISLVTFGIK